MKKRVSQSKRRPPSRDRPTASSGVATPGYHPRVVVKFRDSVVLPYDDRVERFLDETGVLPWRLLKAQFPGITIRELFNSVAPSQINRLVADARHRSEWYRAPNFLTYFVIDLPANIDTEERGKKYSDDLVKALSEWESVERAYFETEAEEPENNLNGIEAIQDPDMPLQNYLSVATGGIGADFAWGIIPGGDGAGVQFIDIERCWTRNHQDLQEHQAQRLWGEEERTVACTRDFSLGSRMRGQKRVRVSRHSS